jgi:hypothetical protein
VKDSDQLIFEDVIVYENADVAAEYHRKEDGLIMVNTEFQTAILNGNGQDDLLGTESLETNGSANEHNLF